MRRSIRPSTWDLRVGRSTASRHRSGPRRRSRSGLRSWTNELYLWYREVPDVDPATYSATANYFAILKTSATTSTGHPKDRFHFTYLTAQWEQLSQAGVDIGYGVTWDLTV